MDIYIVRDGENIIGVSAKWQGAELIRTEHATASIKNCVGRDAARAMYRTVYDRTAIENHDVKDLD